MISRIAAALAVAVSGVALTDMQHAQAQAYPTRPVRMIVPFPPGGNTDIIARIVAPRMTESLGQQLIIDNRGGAGSTIGTEVAAKSPADGYTILMVSAAHTINPAMVKKLPYDSIKDFTPISVVADVPTVFVSHPSLPVKNLAEFLALARKRPGEITYSTAGRGTVGHLAAELLSSMTKINIVHVPYKGTGPAVVDLMAGHVQLQFASMPAVIQFVRAGKLRMLAQAGEKRSPAAKGVPTMVESGLPTYIISSGFSVFGPAGLARPMVDRVHAAVKASLSDSEVRRKLSDQGADPVGSTPEQHDKFNRAEIEKWIKVARGAGIEPQ
ncbi:MAG: tripartite tricarboxylate transporter substrate binding protein [Burkholderiales bacterium]|nr:tripartite tricarboxylate transporter substrate binding protein [Burkholderiales bacterium]